MEGFNPLGTPRKENAPDDPVVKELASVAEGLERKLQIEPAPPGELNTEQAEDLHETIHKVIDKQ